MIDLEITALMPTCGRTLYIGESIYSFLNQTYKNKKIIILDTHPQNISFDIDLPKNIEYIKANSFDFKTLGDKFKYLINSVQTELFCIWEDDDIWLPNHLNSLINTYKNNYIFSNKPFKIGNKNHYVVLGGVDKSIHSITLQSNVCWCRYIYENKNINLTKLNEPFDVSFINLFDSIWDKTNPTYIYRWDNGQCHMSGLYGQKSYNELYRLFEDSLMNTDISKDIVKIEWRHDYANIIKTL